MEFKLENFWNFLIENSEYAFIPEVKSSFIMAFEHVKSMEETQNNFELFWDFLNQKTHFDFNEEMIPEIITAIQVSQIWDNDYVRED